MVPEVEKEWDTGRLPRLCQVGEQGCPGTPGGTRALEVGLGAGATLKGKKGPLSSRI